MKYMKSILTFLLVLTLPFLVSAQLTQQSRVGDGGWMQGGSISTFTGTGTIGAPVLGSPDGLQGTVGILRLDGEAATNRSPEITLETFEWLVDENSPAGTQVVQVTAEDPDGDLLTYSLTSVAFAIDQLGNITVADSSLVNHELNDLFTLMVTVSDGEESDTVELDVTVFDVNEAPVILNESLEFTMEENSPQGTVLVQVEAADEDEGDDVLEYELYSDVFVIDEQGLISVANPELLDHENSAVRTLTLFVSDGIRQSSASVTVNVTDVNEAPVFTDAVFEMWEGLDIGTALPIPDIEDPEGDELSFSIVSGNSGQKFTIDASTGEISLIGVLDFEQVHTYLLGISVSDGNLITIGEVEVQVLDANEFPVVNAIDYSVREDAATGTIIGSISASDPEEDPIVYSISGGNDEGAFSIDSSGNLLVANSALLDFETSMQFDLTIGISDGVQPIEIGITVYIEDVAESQPPVAFAPGYEIFLLDGDHVILEGYDPDGDALDYDILNMPSTGTLLATGTENGFGFAPDPSQGPEILYSDSVVFQVVEETPLALTSEPATLRFRYEVTDEPHEISTLTATPSGNTIGFGLTWTDEVFNAVYQVRLSYYDLSSPSLPQIRTLVSTLVELEDLTIDGSNLSFGFDAAESAHPYLFGQNNVFVTAQVSSPNGNSDFASFVYNPNTGARVEASADGLFFAFGSDMTVKENGQVNLRMLAVELGDHDLTGATIELLSDPDQGSVGQPVIEETTDNTITWKIDYASTEDIAGLDSIQFRIFHPDRQLFDTAWARVEIVGVNDVPRIAPITDKQINEDEQLELALDISDPDNEIQVIVESNENSSVPVSYSNGILTVSPVTDFSGNVSINVVVREVGTEQLFVAYDRFNLEIVPVNDAPVVTAILDQVIDEDETLNLTIAATDVDASTPVFDFAATSSNPSELEIVVTGNTIQVVPLSNVNGDYKIYVTADDRLGTTNSISEIETFELTITPVNDAPEVQKLIPTQNLLVGFPAYNLDLAAYFSDVETESLDFDVSGNSGIVLGLEGAILTVEVGDGFTGNEDITILASDGEADVSQVVTFIVSSVSTNVNVANALADLELDEDFGLQTVDLSTVFAQSGVVDPDFEYSLLGANYLDVQLSEDGTEIEINSLLDYNGQETIYVIASVDGQSAFESFQIDVSPINDLPVIGSIAAITTKEDVARTGIFVEVSDVETSTSELTLEISSGDEELLAPNGIEVTSTTGGFVLALDPNLNAFGSTTLTLVVSDGTGETEQTVDFTITAVNDAPVKVSSAIVAAVEDALYSLDLSELFMDADGETLSYEVVQIPEWATLSGTLLSGTPDNDDVGVSTLQVRVEDPSEASVQAIYDLAVTNTNDIPKRINPVSDLMIFQDNDWRFTVPGSVFDDIDDGDELTLSIDQYPDWVQLNGATLSGQPSYDDIGIYEIVIRGTDMSGTSARDTFLVEVIFTNYPAVVLLTATEVCVGEDFLVEATGAVDYNWYDNSGQLLQTGGSTFTASGVVGTVVFVEGKDEEGRTTSVQTEIAISVAPIPDVSISLQDDALVASVSGDVTYQWYEDNVAIESANSASFEPAVSGEYTVVVTSESGCSAEASSVFKLLGLGDLSGVEVYPNPVIDWVMIRGSHEMNAQLFDAAGRRVMLPLEVIPDGYRLNLGEAAAGVYYLQISSGSKTGVQKLIKVN